MELSDISTLPPDELVGWHAASYLFLQPKRDGEMAALQTSARALGIVLSAKSSLVALNVSATAMQAALDGIGASTSS